MTFDLLEVDGELRLPVQHLGRHEQRGELCAEFSRREPGDGDLAEIREIDCPFSVDGEFGRAKLDAAHDSDSQLVLRRNARRALRAERHRRQHRRDQREHHRSSTVHRSLIPLLSLLSTPEMARWTLA